jgi:DNA helicase-2/ATP-dependent DNA helicase PcrA
MSIIAPSDEQQAVLDLGHTSIRIRAGAGTGKTTTVAMVIVNLIESHGVEPEEILGVTFTNKAAAELSDRVRRLLKDTVDPGRQVEIHTYHGFAAQVLAEFGPLAGVDNRAQVITPTFSRQLMSETFHHTSYDHLDITNTRALNKIRQLGDRLGDHLLTADDLIAESDGREGETWAMRREMAQTLARYANDKRRLRVVDYSDLVTLSTLITREHPALAAEIRARYRAVVLDEYQDTNPAQRALLTSIFTEGFPVVAVGDEDQTIYEWRGASAENFELFATTFPRVDGSPAHESELRLNRRSAPAILAVANDIRVLANPEAEELRPVHRDVEGEVITHWARDAVAEADWIARRFEALHDAGESWRDMAVLFRKNKDFAVVLDALTSHDIPVEVANIGGLLSVPEVAEIRAWLTALEHPEDSAAITQILFGSRFSLGMADLVHLTRWAADADDTDEDADDPNPITLIEAIEAAEEIPGLRPGALAALQRYRSIYREALSESQGMTLIETCRLILDRTRAWQDVEALPPNARLTSRLNLYRLLDLAEDWSPLKGRPSVEAFLEYLETMEDEPAEELDSARLSGEDAVTLVTVHRAKGLEWETVAVPAVAKDNFPSRTQQHPDPERFPEFLPPEMRIDSVIDDLPTEESERTSYLRDRHTRQEWRVAYVAATRAKRRLFVSGAYWYGLPEPSKTPKEPSELFDLIEAHATSVSAGHAEPGERPPILRAPDRTAAPDPLFDDGWASALRLAMEDSERIDEMARDLNVEDEYRERLDAMESRLFRLAEPMTDEADDDPTITSVTGLVTYAQCPKRFYWSQVDPLPRSRNPAAERGTELHRRIELHQRGHVPFEEMSDDLYDQAPDEVDAASGGYRAYEQSRFGVNRAALVEAPFSIELEAGQKVRGRIDAIYREAGSWEIVDFKSGRPKQDPSRLIQLQAYAVASQEVDFGIPGPDEVEVTFAYLGGGLTEETYRADQNWLRQARKSLNELAEGIRSEKWDPTPGDWCHNCDFLRFCPAGRAWTAE